MNSMKPVVREELNSAIDTICHDTGGKFCGSNLMHNIYRMWILVREINHNE